MSLINKMLQDLDARGGAPRAATGDVRPVAPDRTARTARTAIAAGAGVGALIVAVGAGVWYYVNRTPAAPVPVVAAPPVAAPVPTPVPKSVPESPPAPAAPAADPTVAEAAPVPAPEPAPRAAPEAVPAEAAAPKPRRERKAAAEPRPAPVADAMPAQGVTTTPQQRAENAYRRGLAAVQDGRVQDAIAALEQAVQAEPRHEAARQTLVGLLIENGRVDDAIRQAALGLGINANQPQLAMVLARLQLEHGGPAVETLRRTLPHATDNAAYMAFLAGVLQKQRRYAEAAEQYEAALRLQPKSGVWWMGLGIARQGGQLPGARDAYLKAKAAGLTPELQEFVERKLAQLDS